MKKWAVLLLLISLALSGCNTLAGVGKDLERAGEAIQDSAN
jgi:predicted small secreted protein